jgi:hypothetical protein
MFYFFRRGGATIRCEVRSDSEGKGYELIVDRPDRMVTVESFGAPPELNRRWREIERTLIREGWHGPRGLVSTDLAMGPRRPSLSLAGRARERPGGHGG